MRITIETNNWGEIEQLITFLNSLKITSFNIVQEGKSSSEAVITKGNKDIKPTSLFGIWKDNPRNLLSIRAKAWKPT